MKNLYFSMSDNLYYLDQYGDIDSQLSWLKSLSISEAQHVVPRCGSEYVMLLILTFHAKRFYSALIKVFPGLVVRSFLNRRVVNLPVWLLNNGFCVKNRIVEFKSLKSCLEEEENSVVGTTADAVDRSLLED